MRAHWMLLAVAFIYGLNYIIAREAMIEGGVPPNAFILMRVAFAALAFHLFHRQRLPHSWRLHAHLALCGLTGIALNQLLFFNGLKLSGPIQSSLIMTVTPVLVYVLSMLYLGTTFKWFKAIGVLMGMVGAILIIHTDDTGPFLNAPLGNLYVFLNATSYAIYLVIVKSLMVKYDPLLILKWVFTYGFLIVLGFGFKPLMHMDTSLWDGQVIGAILYVIIFTTYLAYRFNGQALKYVAPVIAGIYLYLQPVIATAASTVLGIERLDIKKSVAAVLILVAIWLVSSKETPWRRVRKVEF